MKGPSGRTLSAGTEGVCRRGGEGALDRRPPPRALLFTSISAGAAGLEAAGGLPGTRDSGCDRISGATTTGRLFETPLAGRTSSAEREGEKVHSFKRRPLGDFPGFLSPTL